MRRILQDDASLADPWRVDESSLNDLNRSQFFLVWAFNLNRSAKYFLDGEAVTHGWTSSNAIRQGVASAISAVNSLAHARLASLENRH